jgi:hypothetical protein
MASIHTTAGWPYHSALRGIDLVIFDELEARAKVGRMIFNVRDSSQYQEDTLTVGGIGNMPQKLEGEALSYTSATEGFRQTFTHLDYGYGMRVTRNLLREEMYGTMENLGMELSRSQVATEETILANIFNRAFNSSYTGADGLELCSTAHVREDGTTFANELSSAADLSQTSLEQAMIDFSDFRDGGSKRIVIEPAILLVPKELRFEAARYTQSKLAPETDTNAINPVEGLLKVQVWNYLTDTDAWFILGEKKDHFLRMYDREEFWTDYEYDFDSKDYKISGMFAMSAGWASPLGVFGTPGA